jgi:hypothetical protein
MSNSVPSEGLTSAQFDEALKAVGVDVTPVTVRRWSHENLLTPPLGATHRTKWRIESVGEAALIFMLREGDPLVTATPLGVRLLLKLVRAMQTNAVAWKRFWKDDDERTVGDVTWHPHGDPLHHSLVIDGVTAYFKAIAGVHIREHRAISFSWVKGPDRHEHLKCTLEPPLLDEDGQSLGNSLQIPTFSKASLRRIKNARLPEMP